MSETASILKIDGVEAPTPYNFGLTYSDYDSKNSSRSETWVLNREIIRTDLKSHAFYFRLKTPEMRQLIKMIKPAKITVSFFDLNASAESPYTEFVGYADPTRKVQLLHWNSEDPEESWWELDTSFIEY